MKNSCSLIGTGLCLRKSKKNGDTFMGDEVDYIQRILFEMHAEEKGIEEAQDFFTRQCLALDLVRSGVKDAFETAYKGSRWEEMFRGM